MTTDKYVVARATASYGGKHKVGGQRRFIPKGTLVPTSDKITKDFPDSFVTVEEYDDFWKNVQESRA